MRPGGLESAASIPKVPPPLLHQRIPRRRQLQKRLHVAACVRVSALGDALVGAVDLGFGKATVERQAKQLPMAFFGRGQFHGLPALAELRSGQREQDVADDAEPSPRRIAGKLVSRLLRGAPKDRHRLGRCLAQDRLLACTCDMLRQTHSLAVVGRVGGPNSLEFKFPFRDASFHGEANVGIGLPDSIHRYR